MPFLKNTEAIKMPNLLERSILLTIGAASLSRDFAEALTADFMGRGQKTSEQGREAAGELLERARDETRAARSRLDASLQRTFRDMGLATVEQMEEMELKLAQLEHRLSLLEQPETQAVNENKKAE